MGVFDQAEKLERGQGPTSTSAGNVFDQAQQLDGSKWGNRLTEPSGSTDVGPIAPPAAPLAPWQQGTSPGSLQVEADTSLPTQAGIAVTNAADAAGQAYTDFYTGTYKQIGKKAYGATKLTNEAIRKVAPSVPPMPSEADLGSAIGVKPDFLEPTNTMQKAGGVSEDVGEFLLPAGEIAKGAEATKAALGGGRLAKLAALGVRSAGEGAVSGAQELFKTADVEKAGSAATTQAATSAAMGPIGAGASWLGKRAFANILKTAATDFRFGRDPVEAVRNSGIVANSLGDLHDKLATELTETGQTIRSLVDQSPNATTFDRTKVAQLIRDPISTQMSAVQKFGGSAVPLSRMRASLSAEAANAQTLGDLHELKTSIGHQIRWAGESQIENARQAALREIYGRLNSFIDTNAPGVKDVQAHYGGILAAGKSVDKEIALRSRAKVNFPFFSVAGLGLGLQLGHPVVGSIGLMTRTANAGLKQPAVVTRLAKLGDPAYATAGRAAARYLLGRGGGAVAGNDSDEGDSYAGQK